MSGDEIEEALQRLLGDAAGPSGLVITVRRHDEYEVLLGRVSLLEKERDRLRSDLGRMSGYADLYLRALDELKICVRMMRSEGMDTSFVSSLR